MAPGGSCPVCDAANAATGRNPVRFQQLSGFDECWSCACSLPGRKIPQVGWRLVLACRHQVAVAADDVVVPADQHMMIILGAERLGPQRLRAWVAVVGARHGPGSRQRMVKGG